MRDRDQGTQVGPSQICRRGYLVCECGFYMSNINTMYIWDGWMQGHSARGTWDEPEIEAREKERKRDVYSRYVRNDRTSAGGGVWC